MNLKHWKWRLRSFEWAAEICFFFLFRLLYVIWKHRCLSFESSITVQFLCSAALRCAMHCSMQIECLCVYCVECKQIGSHMEVIVHIRKVSVFRHFSFSEKRKQQNNLINSSESKAHLIEIKNKTKNWKQKYFDCLRCSNSVRTMLAFYCHLFVVYCFLVTIWAPGCIGLHKKCQRFQHVQQ